MSLLWIKTSPSLVKGIKLNNSLDDAKYEHFLKRIVIKLKNKDLDIFTEEERRKLETIFKINDEELLLSIKTIVYIFKRIFKYIFLPIELKNDLSSLGFTEKKIEAILKLWSSEISSTLQNLTTSIEKSNDEPSFLWKLNSELCSDYHKRSKVPKAYVSINNGSESTEIELSHTELHSIFLQLESVQNELDSLLS
ncbi:COMM domain-containing protein 10 [Aricia agestis]|uniref:COMM domain-containing protein 10 n=1 Tax=Aricia agestis TaxID=91739 RepID=UPI001C201604|nr:COMM domain-containing protein 10 [Aricia agestis]